LMRLVVPVVVPPVVLDVPVVWADTAPNIITKRATTRLFLRKFFIFLFSFYFLLTPHIIKQFSCLYYGKNLPINPLTILSDRSSGKNFKKPRKYKATHPYTNIFKHISNVFWYSFIYRTYYLFDKTALVHIHQ
jgi:hypothetical protein